MPAFGSNSPSDLDDALGASQAAVESRPRKGGGPGEDYVLLADEDFIVNDLMAHRLSRAGVATFSTSEGDEALALLKDPFLKAVVVSITLPGRSGFEILASLRAETLYGYVPLIMLMWPGNPDEVVRALESGADDVVEKPFVPAELVARVRRVLIRVESSRTGTLKASPAISTAAQAVAPPPKNARTGAQILSRHG